MSKAPEQHVEWIAIVPGKALQHLKFSSEFEMLKYFMTLNHGDEHRLVRKDRLVDLTDAPKYFWGKLE